MIRKKSKIVSPSSHLILIWKTVADTEVATVVFSDLNNCKGLLPAFWRFSATCLDPEVLTEIYHNIPACQVPTIVHRIWKECKSWPGKHIRIWVCGIALVSGTFCPWVILCRRWQGFVSCTFYKLDICPVQFHRNVMNSGNLLQCYGQVWTFLAIDVQALLWKEQLP